MKQQDGTARESEVAHKVQRYEHALALVLRQRPAVERTAAITNAEHLLAVQIAENVTAYEAGLRERRPLPEKVITPDKGAPAQEAVPAGRATPRRGDGRRRRKPARRATPRKRSAPAEAKAE